MIAEKSPSRHGEHAPRSIVNVNTSRACPSIHVSMTRLILSRFLLESNKLRMAVSWSLKIGQAPHWTTVNQGLSESCLMRKYTDINDPPVNIRDSCPFFFSAAAESECRRQWLALPRPLTLSRRVSHSTAATTLSELTKCPVITAPHSVRRNFLQ